MDNLYLGQNNREFVFRVLHIVVFSYYLFLLYFEVQHRLHKSQ